MPSPPGKKTMSTPSPDSLPPYFDLTPGPEPAPYKKPKRWKVILSWLGVVLGGLLLITGVFDLEISSILMGFGMLLPGAWFLLHEDREKKGAAPLPRHWIIVSIVSLVSVFGGSHLAPTPEEATTTAPSSTTSKPTSTASTTTKASPSRRSPKSSPQPSTKSSPTSEPKPETTEEDPSPSIAPEPSEQLPQPVREEPHVDSQPHGFVAPVDAGAPAATGAPAPAITYFKNCAQARAAGAAPIYRGEPGYRGKLDRDGDGVACE